MPVAVTTGASTGMLIMQRLLRLMRLIGLLPFRQRLAGTKKFARRTPPLSWLNAPRGTCLRHSNAAGVVAAAEPPYRERLIIPIVMRVDCLRTSSLTGLLLKLLLGRSCLMHEKMGPAPERVGPAPAGFGTYCPSADILFSLRSSR